MLDQIKSLHDLGFSILWLLPQSKRPVEKDWTKLPGRSWDAQLMSYKNGMNIGVRLGVNSKLTSGNYLTVIDCDVKSTDPVHLKEMEKALDKLLPNWTLGPAVMSGRGNGSKHIYGQTHEPVSPFRAARSHHAIKVLMPSVTKFSKREEEELTVEEMSEGWHIRPAWEIGVMGTGQQVVLPPSVHPDSKKPYIWSREIKSVNDLPVMELSREAAESVRVIKDAPEFKDTIVDLVSSSLPDWAYEMIVHGKGLERYEMDRSAALFAVTMCMINAGFTDGEIMNVLTDPDYELSWVAYEHRKTKDRKSAAQWVYKYTISKARYEKSAQKAFEDSVNIVDQILTPEEAAKQNAEFKGTWREQLDRTQQLAPRNTFKNINLILANAPGKTLFEYDDFYHDDIYKNKPPWAEPGDKDDKWIKKSITDNDLSRARLWIANEFRFEPSQNQIAESIAYLANKNKKHPVREYLNSLTWDGVPRIDSWLETYMNAEGPKDYLRAVGSKLLVACVARVMEPGCKWDYVVIFEGLQGIGKSTACSILGGDWFTDNIGDITNKDVVDGMRGKWIVEIGELAVMRRHEVESMKHFITTRVDNVRKAYAKKAEHYPRQCVFIGTTNRNDYLKDETGNRRFFPVSVRGVDFDKLIDDRDQLWAEAYERWVDGEKLYLDKDLEKVAKEVQELRVEQDEWQAIVEEIFSATTREKDSIVPKFPKENFRLMDLWKEMSQLSDLVGIKFTKADQQRLGKVLSLMGYKSKNTRVNGVVQKRWFLKEM